MKGLELQTAQLISMGGASEVRALSFPTIIIKVIRLCPLFSWVRALWPFWVARSTGGIIQLVLGNSIC